MLHIADRFEANTVLCSFNTNTPYSHLASACDKFIMFGLKGGLQSLCRHLAMAINVTTWSQAADVRCRFTVYDFPREFGCGCNFLVQVTQ